MSGRAPWAAVLVPPVRASAGRQLFAGLLAGLLACVAGLVPLQAQAGRLGIELADGTPEEAQARTQLHRLVREFDLAPWLFTRRVRIQAMAIPHSHPVLTLNTRYLGRDEAQVATFVHEQLHWFLGGERRAATDAAIAELRTLYPDAPDGPPAGARDLESTYLHLLVCALEHQAMRRLYGDEVAERTLRGWRHYPWVYAEVLDRPGPIWDILRRHGLDDPDARRDGASPRNR